MNSSFSFPQDIARQKNLQLLAQFGEDPLEKAITGEEFTGQYGQGHNIYRQEDLNKAIAATAELVKKNPEKEDELVKGLTDQISTLKPIMVKGADGALSMLYIQKAKVEETEPDGDEEEEDDSPEDLEDEEKKKVIQKSIEYCEAEELVKGRAYPDGTIREHGGVKVKKEGGKWIPVIGGQGRHREQKTAPLGSKGGIQPNRHKGESPKQEKKLDHVSPGGKVAYDTPDKTWTAKDHEHASKFHAQEAKTAPEKSENTWNKTTHSEASERHAKVAARMREEKK